MDERKTSKGFSSSPPPVEPVAALRLRHLFHKFFTMTKIATKEKEDFSKDDLRKFIMLLT